MSPRSYTALPDAVTRRLQEAAEADRNRGIAHPHREDTAHQSDDLFVADWTMTPAPPPKTSTPVSSGISPTHPMDAMTVELSRSLRSDAEFDHLH